MCGFGGLEVSVLASGTLSSRVQTRPKPSDFSSPSFGGEVKPSVPCRKFTACKNNPKSDVKVTTFGKILGKFLAHSSTFRCWGTLASFQTWGDTWWRELERSNHWSSKLRVRGAAGNGTL